MRVRQCCCGISLKLGTVFIATFYLVLYVPALVTVFVLGLGYERRDEMFRSESVEGLGTEQRHVVINIAYGLVIAAISFAIVLNIVLMMGALCKKASLLYIWFMFHILSILVMAVTVVVNTFSRIADVRRRVGTIGPTTANIFLTLYFLVVVHSYYEEIREEKVRRYLEQLSTIQRQRAQHPQHIEMNRLRCTQQPRQDQGQPQEEQPTQPVATPIGVFTVTTDVLPAPTTPMRY